MLISFLSTFLLKNHYLLSYSRKNDLFAAILNFEVKKQDIHYTLNVKIIFFKAPYKKLQFDMTKPFSLEGVKT